MDSDYRYNKILLILLEVYSTKFTYDPRYNIAYIQFQEKTTEVETIRISDELSVDMAPDGKIYGIELLNANEQLQQDEKGKLSIINESTGEYSEMKLSFSD